MQFKELEWKDIVSDGIIVCSNCRINLCGVIKMEFNINHEPKENKYIPLEREVSEDCSQIHIIL